ncbi:hypothetical protein GCM10023168_34290 [Fodinibacter luteus]|uniref:WXG100 family type VII secretion target n=1 Tax=Fodinibacter luteus TaxID=552064 RepID=A0ABP8KQ99_9MICO
MPGTGELRDLAAALRGAARRVEARRAALGRYALVWWEGTAAEAYQQQVAHRVTALATLARELDEAAVLAEEVVALAEQGGVLDP